MLIKSRKQPGQKTSRNRAGTVLVETAIVSSVFGLFLAGIMEFGHAYMVINTMNAAAKRSARYGSTDGVTTAQVKAMANRIMNSAFHASKATILVKDASVFDNAGMDPKAIKYESLQDLELDEAKKQQMYVVRITVPYNSVALLPPFWVKNATLKVQAVMRHE